MPNEPSESQRRGMIAAWRTEAEAINKSSNRGKVLRDRRVTFPDQEAAIDTLLALGVALGRARVDAKTRQGRDQLAATANAASLIARKLRGMKIRAAQEVVVDMTEAQAAAVDRVADPQTA